MGSGGSLLPGALWANMREASAQRVSAQVLQGALVVAGLELSEEDQLKLLDHVNSNLEQFESLRKIHIPDEIEPPLHFSALVPGMKVNREKRAFGMSVPAVERPADLEQLAFSSVATLARLIATRAVKSLELTRMYLERLKRYGRKGVLNCVVTLLEERALALASKADAEIAAGRYRGPLHGIPWGIKDIFAVKGYRTTWGFSLKENQVLDYDASVVEMLDEAGAILVAKLSTSELAGGDDLWFGGQTRNPWNMATGTGGSSSGSAAATAAGLVGFSLGSETDGSILWPSARCGVTGLRPTFGRISRHGAMALSWTTDRPGPMCRHAEDCALVMREIARPDGRDLSVMDVPFNWDARSDARALRIGYLARAFEEVTEVEGRRNNELLIEQVRALGVKLVAVDVPDFPTRLPALRLESAAFFDELIRSGQDRSMRDRRRVDWMRAMRLVPGVEYLQAQRARMMLMMKLAEATQGVDVYFGPISVDFKKSNAVAATGGEDVRRQGTAQRHSEMANLATYPALAVPCGFAADGMPQSVTFFARPFGETELLSFGKAYQEATGVHLRRPVLPGYAS